MIWIFEKGELTIEADLVDELKKIEGMSAQVDVLEKAWDEFENADKETN
ncbi:13098_t:CDS:2 [Entrophospora sp. SA101]|nr:13098_t:CDS:2 [Entrophospora sp. SA101]CAJ0840117.1 8418_t:CDS:2 [Entrophospora sp. SA101]